MKNVEKTAIYLRSSKDRSDVSIDAQRRQLQDLASKKGFAIAVEYADAVESGKDDDRPGFQAMLRDIKSKSRGWGFILVLDTSRIARKRHLSFMFEMECEKAGIKVFYKSLPESDPITDMLLKSFLQAIDEWHSLTSKAKGLAGMAENVRQGWRAGGKAPKGYKLEYVATGAIREGEPVTKSRLILGDDAIAVGCYLKARATGTPRNRALSMSDFKSPSSTLVDIEKNALVYAGHTVWNRHNEKASGGGYIGGTKFRPKDQWEIKKNTHEALITEDEAEAILNMVGKQTSRARKSINRVYLLSGLLESPEGSNWHSDGDGSYRLGKGKRVNADAIEQAIMEKVITSLSADDMVDAILNHFHEIAKQRESRDTSKKFRSAIKEIDTKIEKLTGLLTETTAPDALLRTIEKLEIERKAVAEELKIVEEESQSTAVYKNLTRNHVRTMLKSVIENLQYTENKESLKDALNALVDNVVLDPASLTASVTYRVGPQSGDKMASPRGFEPRSPP